MHFVITKKIKQYKIVRTRGLLKSASRNKKSVSMVPTPNKLIKMIIKNRALSHLGFTVETGYHLNKSHQGKGMGE